MKYLSIDPAPRGYESTTEIGRLKSHVQALGRSLTNATRRERQRMADWLHDDLGQHLVLVRLKLAELCRAQPDQSVHLIGELTELISSLSSKARAETFQLNQAPADRPHLDIPETRFSEKLDALSLEVSRRTGLMVLTTAPNAPNAPIDLPMHLQALACRIVRELCLNVHKHAGAHRVSIHTRIEGGALQLSVRDDGRGFACAIPPVWRARPDGGFGLARAQADLQALGGRLSVSCEPGRGSCVSLLLPLRVASGPRAAPRRIVAARRPS